jgi:hypothetical protein
MVVSTVVANGIWKVGASTWEFVGTFVKGLAKLVTVVGLWVVMILLVNKFEVVFADFHALTRDTAADAKQMLSDITAPLLSESLSKLFF